MIKIQNTQPDDIRFNYYKTQRANQFTEFGNLVPANNNSIVVAPYGQWEVNNNCEVTILSPTRIRIDKFQIDTWIIRIKTGSAYANIQPFSNLLVKVEGLTYLHENVICHTNDTPNGFGQFFLETSGWNVYSYPGQFTSGFYAQGLLIQGCMNYLDNTDTIGNSLHMGRAPWDIGNYTFVNDGVAKTKAWYGIGANGICIGLYGGLQTASKIMDTSNGAYKIYDISDHPLYLDLDTPDTSLNIDPSTDTCYKVYVGNTQVYNKSKTIQECWIDKGLVKIEPPIDGTSTRNFIKATGATKLDGFNGVILPETDDLEEHILPKNSSNIAPIMWCGDIHNQNIVNRIQEYVNTHDFVLVQEAEQDYNTSQYTIEDSNCIERHWFSGSGFHFSNLKINFDGSFHFIVFYNLFNGCTIDNLTLQFKQENLYISSAQNFLRGANIKNLVVLDKDGDVAWEKGKAYFGAYDISAIREFGSGLKVFPPIIRWQDVAQFKGYWGTNTAYAFSYDNELEEIQEFKTYARDHINNTIVFSGFSAQTFQNCSALKRIGPTLSFRYINPSSQDNIYAMFSGCTALEDVRIKSLNAGTWNFDNSAYPGNLPKLNQESITYLITNALDLTTYDPNTSEQASTSFEKDWTYGWTYTNEYQHNQNAKSYNWIKTDTRIPSSWPDLFAQTAIELLEVEISVDGLQEGDILYWNDQEMTADGNYTISGAGGFKLINTNISNNKTYRDQEHTITIYLTNPFDKGAPFAATGEIHCPETWRDKLNSDLISLANSKGWSLWIGDEELKVDTIGVLLLDGTKIPYSSVPTEGYTSG